MKKNLYIILTVVLGINLQSQTKKVGINTSNPTETLDVNGKTYTDILYLRKPGEPTLTGGHFLASPVISNKNATSLQMYDPLSGNSSLFNYIQLNLTDVPKEGIVDYDTKIDATNFSLVIHNYGIKLADGTTFVSLDYIGTSAANDNKQGSPEFITFKSGGTWHIKAKFTNSNLMKSDNTPSTSYNTFRVELYMMAYKRLITKQNINDITIDLAGGDGNGIVLPKPTGF